MTRLASQQSPPCASLAVLPRWDGCRAGGVENGPINTEPHIGAVHPGSLRPRPLVRQAPKGLISSLPVPVAYRREFDFVWRCGNFAMGFAKMHRPTPWRVAMWFPYVAPYQASGCLFSRSF